jgi:hypothetical protein
VRYEVAVEDIEPNHVVAFVLGHHGLLPFSTE